MAYAGLLADGRVFQKQKPKVFYDQLTGNTPNSIFCRERIRAWSFFGACIAINNRHPVRVVCRREIENRLQDWDAHLDRFRRGFLAVRGLMISPATDPHAVASSVGGPETLSGNPNSTH